MIEQCASVEKPSAASVDAEHHEALADAIVKIAVALGITDGTTP